MDGRMSNDTLTSDLGLLRCLVAGLDYAAQLSGPSVHTCADCGVGSELLWYLVRTRRRGHYKTLCCKCMVALKRKWISPETRSLG
jgi:hypothetical protein